jgi:hypothetical protein
MKSKLTQVLLVAAMVFGSVSSRWALPPRQHAVRGVIESMDPSTHTLTVAPANGSKALVFVWKDSTRFKQGWSRFCSGALKKGAPVTVYYRREIGQLVRREVNVRGEAGMPCAIGECCGKRS